MADRSHKHRGGGGPWMGCKVETVAGSMEVLRWQV